MACVCFLWLRNAAGTFQLLLGPEIGASESG